MIIQSIINTRKQYGQTMAKSTNDRIANIKKRVSQALIADMRKIPIRDYHDDDDVIISSQEMIQGLLNNKNSELSKTLTEIRTEFGGKLEGLEEDIAEAITETMAPDYPDELKNELDDNLSDMILKFDHSRASESMANDLAQVQDEQALGKKAFSNSDEASKILTFSLTEEQKRQLNVAHDNSMKDTFDSNRTYNPKGFFHQDTRAAQKEMLNQIEMLGKRTDLSDAAKLKAQEMMLQSMDNDLNSEWYGKSKQMKGFVTNLLFSVREKQKQLPSTNLTPGEIKEAQSAIADLDRTSRSYGGWSQHLSSTSQKKMSKLLAQSSALLQDESAPEPTESKRKPNKPKL